VPVRCVEVDNAEHLYLASLSMIPTHNSTLGLDLARSAAVRHGLTTAIFSLEMTRNEITMRLLSAEARVALHHMRSGTMTDEDWTRLARRMSEVAEAPLFIDDSPNMTMMEIRAKCRRLKQRHDLRMVIVDYMQLMTSGKRVESRQLEVSEFSRSMKLLAKELDVPVVAISQLNRGPEQRTDKKPLLSDLRESGCLPASTRVLRADTGVEVSLGELLTSAARDVPVWSLDESLRLVARPMTHVFPSGRKEVFRLRLTSGRTIEATANHPFLSYDGWRPLGELAPGDRLATPRRVPAPLQPRPWADAQVVMLAHLLVDGSLMRGQPIRYASTDEANLAAVTDAARHFGVTAVRDDHAAACCTSLRLPAPYRLSHNRRHPIAAWLDGMGLFGLRSHEKFVPAGVFSLPDGQLGAFLRHLWATDGSVIWDSRQGQARLYYASTSRRLVDDVARLLLRFGVLTRCTTVRKPGYPDSYHLYVYGAENQLRFLDQIGVHGARGVVCAVVAEQLRGVVGRATPDTIPREVWQRVQGLIGEKSMTHRQHATSRAGLARVTAVLDSVDLQLLATNDVCWDEVASIERLGEQDVFDATVLGTHNFIADGIAVHNSLEQDADMVILMHREDAYERESPRAGEADLIVAKHRNGPTRTITVAFQGHYSRFVDMARH
jgi:replicative DNA helicase